MLCVQPAYTSSPHKHFPCAMDSSECRGHTLQRAGRFNQRRYHRVSRIIIQGCQLHTQMFRPMRSHERHAYTFHHACRFNQRRCRHVSPNTRIVPIAPPENAQMMQIPAPSAVQQHRPAMDIDTHPVLMMVMMIDDGCGWW